MRVIADHCRAITFLICDGALPSNEGRGYVLRRIMRRAARHAKMLGVGEPVLYRMVEAVREMMGDAYPELAEREAYIKKVILAEEERFTETLDRGLGILNDEVASLRAAEQDRHPRRCALQAVRHLRLPDRPDRRHRGIEGFTSTRPASRPAWKSSANWARENWKGSGAAGIADIYKAIHNRGIHPSFIGYDALIDLFADHWRCVRGRRPEAESAAAGDQVDVIIESTPFYGESGGQAGDTGTISIRQRPSGGRGNQPALPRPDRSPLPGQGRARSGSAMRST